MTTIFFFYGDNEGSPDTAVQFGPYRTTIGGKLVHVRCTLNISGPPLAIGDASYISDPYAWGVQRGVEGYTPVVTPGQGGSNDFLWSVGHPKESAHSAAWAPSTDSAGYVATFTSWGEWRGQEYNANPYDFYVTASGITASTPEFTAAFVLTATYA